MGARRRLVASGFNLLNVFVSPMQGCALNHFLWHGKHSHCLPTAASAGVLQYSRLPSAVLALAAPALAAMCLAASCAAAEKKKKKKKKSLGLFPPFKKKKKKS